MTYAIRKEYRIYRRNGRTKAANYDGFSEPFDLYYCRQVQIRSAQVFQVMKQSRERQTSKSRCWHERGQCMCISMRCVLCLVSCCNTHGRYTQRDGVVILVVESAQSRSRSALEIQIGI